jgi:hypothetical protein
LCASEPSFVRRVAGAVRPAREIRDDEPRRLDVVEQALLDVRCIPIYRDALSILNQ